MRFFQKKIRQRYHFICRFLKKILSTNFALSFIVLCLIHNLFIFCTYFLHIYPLLLACRRKSLRLFINSFFFIHRYIYIVLLLQSSYLPCFFCNQNIYITVFLCLFIILLQSILNNFAHTAFRQKYTLIFLYYLILFIFIGTITSIQILC